ncbi:hypothetical protein ACFLQW_03095 [Candidatus Zixiibacteriota bacterium]
MIRTVLRDIRAVSGVTGVAILRKRDGFTEHIFPVAFSEEHFHRLYEMLVEAYRHLRGFSYLIMSFDRVTVHLFNRNEFLLLATTLPDLDQRVFEMVVKSKISVFDRILDRIPIAGKSADGRARERTASNTPLRAVLWTMNQLSNKLIADAGRSRVARYWWEARKAATDPEATLSLFTIDPNGHWTIRKGKSLPESPQTSRALAEITELFIAKLDDLQPLGQEIFNSLITSNQINLEASGFLHYLKTARPGRVRAGR